MTPSLLKRQLEASLMWETTMAAQKDIANDRGVQAHRAACARRRPDQSNRSDLTDVCGWWEELEPQFAEFYDEYGESRSPLPFKIADIEEVGDLTKRLICAIQDARERAGILE